MSDTMITPAEPCDACPKAGTEGQREPCDGACPRSDFGANPCPECGIVGNHTLACWYGQYGYAGKDVQLAIARLAYRMGRQDQQRYVEGYFERGRRQSAPFFTLVRLRREMAEQPPPEEPVHFPSIVRAVRHKLTPERIPDGTPGVRDASAPCVDFRPGKPDGECDGDGHYLCAECAERTKEGPSR